jgi:UDP-glucose 4-epimerase
MKCLVTGGAGFVGSHVVDALIEAGHEVTVLDNLSTGKQENLNSEIEFIHGDICDPNIYDFIGDVDCVFHLAALARIQPSIENPVAANEVNLVGTLRVLDFCRSQNAKLVFSGSSSIYGGSNEAMDEDAEKSPKSPYALQKSMCEQYIDLYRELYGLKATILRYFNVYGERQILDGAYAAVVGIFLDQKATGKTLTITNDGEQRRDFTYCKDVAQANLKAVDWEGTFNIGTGKNYSMNELADFIGGEKDYIGERKGEARFTLADNTKARNAGWQPTMDIKDWITDVKAKS